MIIILVALFVTNVFADDDPKDTAKSNASLLKERAGSEKKLKQNFINPLIGSDLLKTLDQSKSGKVQLVCPNSKEFLTIMIIPKGTGDFDANIYWDSNFDEQLDQAFSVTNISGVCTNGFIRCTPGTWQDCKDYTFKFENNNLVVQETYRTELSGCFCVNQSCGSNLIWNNLGYVLKLFGGAIAGAFQSADPRYTISDSLIDGTAIYFYGQKVKDCTVPSGGSGALYPETYYKAPSGISAAVESLVMSQSQDPDSYYNMMVNIGRNTPSQLRSCVIKRNVYSNIQNKYKPCNELMSLPNGTFNFVGGWDSNGESKQCYYDRGSCYLLSGHDNSWDVCYSRIVSEGNLLNFINASFLVGTGYTAVQVVNLNVSGKGDYSSCYGSDDDDSDVWVYVNAICRYIGCQVTESIDDTCSDLESNSSCVLYDEYIDNVQTIRNGSRTGLRPVKQCVTVCGEGTCEECGQVRCYDWISVNRSYLCTDQPIDLSKAEQRLATVVPSTQYDEGQGKLTFSDIRYENGQWVSYPNQVFWVGTGEKPDYCEQACKVRVPRDNTQVSIGNPVSSSQVSSLNPYVYYYRTCENGVCPVESGEEIVTQCQCVNDFGAASTMLQSLRLAGQDIICSSGNSKTLPGY